MKCTHCNNEEATITTEVRVCGNVLNVTVCDDCGENLKKVMGYASAFPSKAGSASPAKPVKQARASKSRAVKKVERAPSTEHKAKFERYALSQAEIDRTQAMRPTVRYIDNAEKRRIDDIDALNAGKQVTVFCMGEGRLSGMALARAKARAAKELGTDDIECIRQNGFERTFRVKEAA